MTLGSSIVKFLTIAPVTVVAALVMRYQWRIKLVLWKGDDLKVFSLRGKWKTLKICRIVCETVSPSEYWGQSATGNAGQKVEID